jgi:hypothetical protein
MLRVGFICSPFVPSKHGVKMTSAVGVFTKGKQRAAVSFDV